MVKAIDFDESEKAGLRIISEFLVSLSATSIYGRAFRGHACSEWEPIPAAFRPGEAGIESAWHFDAWKKTARRFVSSQSASDLEYLVLAQHYGIPTALLDWTANPLVALYFACEKFEELQGGELHEKDGSVLQLDTRSIHNIRRNETVAIFKTDRHEPILLDTAIMNARTIAQDSLMTLHSAKEHFLDVVPVFRIPHLEKFKVKRALRLFGISDERIFPDLTVAATSFRDALSSAKNL